MSQVTDCLSITAMRRLVDREGALRVAASIDGRFASATARELHYPYHWFLIRAGARTFLGESAVRISCLVDARNGLAASSDPFDVVPRSVPRGDVLPGALAEAEADDVAARFLPHVLRSRRRSLVSHRFETLERRLVHRPFWIVVVAGLSLLVDGMSGSFYPIED